MTEAVISWQRDCVDDGTNSHQIRPRAEQLHARVLAEAPGVRGPEEGARHEAGRGHRARQGVGPARPRRRRLSDRPQVAVRPQGHAAAEVHLLQRRRERAGHVQGPRADGAQPAPRSSRAASSAAGRSARRSPTSTSAASSTTCSRCSRPSSPRPTPRATSARTSWAPGFDCDIVIHRGAGAYEAGEETALIESLEGKRAQPRIKPPFPARRPASTTVRPPSTTSRRSATCRRSSSTAPEWFAALGPEKNGGPKLFCVSGHVKKPGVYEASMKTTLRELIYDYAGGIRSTGGSSRPSSPAARRCRSCSPTSSTSRRASTTWRRRGRCSGSAGIIVMDDTTCMVWAAKNLLYFYKHESCGKCTPCREGGDWLYKILTRIETGEGEMRDIDLLVSVGEQHRRQDAVRVRRRRRDAGADDREALPRRVRSPRARGPLHACRRRGARRKTPVGAH